MIRDGRLAAGTRLPPSRVMAGDLGVARSVVVDAYQQLAADGYLSARQGSGTRVLPLVQSRSHRSNGRSRNRVLRWVCSGGCPTRRCSRALNGCATIEPHCTTCPTRSWATRDHSGHSSCGTLWLVTSPVFAVSPQRPNAPWSVVARPKQSC